MVYQFKTVSHIKANAQATGELCERLENTVGLTPKTLLDASRDENSLLHNEFEWQDDVAAEKYREHQAGQIIRSLIIVSEKEESSPIRAFCSIITDSEREYKSIETIINKPDLYDQLLQSAFNELKAFKQKYETLSNSEELQNLFNEIDHIIKRKGV